MARQHAQRAAVRNVPRKKQGGHYLHRERAASTEVARQYRKLCSFLLLRERRAEDTRRWRERLHRGAAVYPVEVDGTTFDIMERFGGLKDSKTGDRQAVATALGKLLRRGLEALLREEAASRR